MNYSCAQRIPALVFLGWMSVQWVPISVAGEAKKGWPEGYVIAEGSASPDGKIGVLIPTRDEADEDTDDARNVVVNLQTHARLGTLKTTHYFEGQNHSSLRLTWAPDSSWGVVIYDGRYGFDTITLLEPHGATCVQTEIGQHVQKELVTVIARQSGDKDAYADGRPYFQAAPGHKIVVRAVAQTNPKSLENVPTWYSLFAGTYDVAAHKWTRSMSRKIDGDETDALENAFADTMGEGTTFASETDRLTWHDNLLNAIYGGVRAILPSEQFAAVKKDELAWVKQLEAAESQDAKIKLMVARIKELRALVWEP